MICRLINQYLASNVQQAAAAVPVLAIIHSSQRWNFCQHAESRTLMVNSTFKSGSVSSFVTRHPHVIGKDQGRAKVGQRRGQQGCRFCHINNTCADGTSVPALKSAILEALRGVNRGIFGVTSKQKDQIESLLQSLEILNPSPRPTENLELAVNHTLDDDVTSVEQIGNGLLYSTISILGVKRTKLGLRDFISFGDFLQIIDVKQNRAINKIGFSVAGIGMLSGALTIEASYSVSSPTRVNIQFESSSIVPQQLFTLFKKNYDLLLSIFNPNGWLEITYVDDTLRVGRDDKGNVFLVERIFSD